MQPNTCDYLRDDAGNYYIIKHCEHDWLFGHLVYEKNPAGGVQDTDGVRYKKVIHNNNLAVPLPPGEILFARQCYQRRRAELPLPWGQLPSVLEQLGVAPRDIGIFGSFMLGLTPYKDIDFCVYGAYPHALVKANIASIKQKLRATDVSTAYATKRLEKLKSFSEHNTWVEIWKRRWSTLCFPNNIGMTIRFNHLSIPNITLQVTDRKKTIEGS